MSIKINATKSDVLNQLNRKKNIVRCELTVQSALFGPIVYADKTSGTDYLLCSDKLVLSEKMTWGQHKNYTCYWVHKEDLDGFIEEMEGE